MASTRQAVCRCWFHSLGVAGKGFIRLRPVSLKWRRVRVASSLTIDASCTPADITYPTDLKLLNEARESTERIIDDLCDQH